MLNTKEHFKQIEMDTIQQEPLFTELTPEAAAVVEGGAGTDSFRAKVNFDTYFPTQPFSVRPGGSITLKSNTQSSKNNLFFSASVRNVNTGKTTQAKTVQVGNYIYTQWTGMRGGTYKIELRDTKDGIKVDGAIAVSYST